MSAYYVYRVYDREGSLIYLGCTSNLFFRLNAHRTTSWWAPQVARVKARVYADKFTAQRKEGDAIQRDHPRWNLNGLRQPVYWTKQQYLDFFTSYLNQREPSEITPRQWVRLKSMRRQYRNKFGEELPIELPLETAA